MKTYRLAILADVCNELHTNSVVRYTTITAFSHREAKRLAGQFGAVICGWVAAA